MFLHDWQMKRFFGTSFATALLALEAGAGVPAVAVRDYPNLLYNPSFEHADFLNNERVEFWQERPYLAHDATVSRTGTYSLRATGPATASQRTFQSGIALRPSTTYELGFWMRSASASLSGQGVRMAYNQTHPNAMTVHQTAWSGASTQWTYVSSTFTTPSNHENGWVLLFFELGAGDTVWVDDVMLRPVSGVVDTAPTPTLSADIPAVGPGLVTLSTDLPGATIRYTTDGSDPHRFSVHYRGPFRIAASMEVRARVFHTGYRESAVASMPVTVHGGRVNGIPFTPVDWQANVSEWWDQHAFNPASPHFDTDPLPTPEPIINVADVRDANPGTTTAGIEEALDLLPEAGGTLLFDAERGPFVVTKPSTRIYNYYYLDGAIHILRRGNIHFVSHNQAEIHHSDYLIGVSSMEYNDTFQRVGGPTFAAPALGFTFRGLTFDGQNQIHQAFLFRHAGDIVFKDCHFRNYADYINPPDPRSEHHGPVNATSMTDNFWMIDCTLQSAGMAVYIDGVHNGGFINCVFEVGAHRDALMMFCNNDMWEWSAEQRTTQYVVVDGCEFRGSGKEGVQVTGAHMLLRNNTQTQGTYGSLATFTGRGPSNLQRYLFYDGSGNYVENNTVHSVNNLVALIGDISQHTRKDQWIHTSEIRENTAQSATTLLRATGFNLPSPMEGIRVRNNRVESNLQTILWAAPSNQTLRDVLFEDNHLVGASLPRVVVDRQPVDEIVVRRNDLFGTARNLLHNQSGQTLPSDAVVFIDNRINPDTRAGPAIHPHGGFYWNQVDVTLTAHAPGETIRYTVDGSDPRVHGLVYTGPLTLIVSGTLRAVSQDADEVWSDLASASFTIGNSQIPPDAPAQLTVTTPGSDVHIVWDPVNDMEDGYTIWRSEDGIHFEAIGQVDLPTSHWIDAGAANSSFFYRVTSERVGTSSSPSPLFFHQPVTHEAPPTHFDGWIGNNIGPPALNGHHTVSNDVVSLVAAGADIWGSADEGYLFAVEATGNWELQARVVSMDLTHDWAKAGLMMRTSFAGDAPHLSLFTTGSQGVHRQMRPSAGSGTLTTSGSSNGRPLWLRMTRQGDHITTLESTDGTTWVTVDESTWSHGNIAWVGLAFTSHQVSQLGEVIFDHISWNGDDLSGGVLMPPDNLHALPEGGLGVHLDWELPGNTPTVWRIERRTGPNAPFALIAHVHGGATHFTDRPLDSMTLYQYRIAGENTDQQSGYSETVDVQTGALTFENWRWLEFPPAIRNQEGTGWTDDHSGDGTPNALAFASGHSATDFITSMLLEPRVVREGDALRWQISYWIREVLPGGLLLYPEESRDLITWHPLDSEEWQVIGEENYGDGRLQRHHRLQASTPGTPRFIRLRVEGP